MTEKPTDGKSKAPSPVPKGLNGGGKNGSGCAPVEDSRLPENERARAELERKVNLVLSDGFMIFLAVLMVPIIVIPLAFPDLDDAFLDFLTFSDIVILLVFVLEYFVKLGLAKDKWAHFWDPWHILDLI